MHVPPNPLQSSVPGMRGWPAELVRHAYVEFGPRSEAHLGAAENLTVAISALRRGKEPSEVVLRLIYRGAGQDAALSEELIAWACRILLRQGCMALEGRLRCYAKSSDARLDQFLLGEQVAKVWKGPYPGERAFLARVSELLDVEPQDLAHFSLPVDGELVLSSVFLPPQDRDLLHRLFQGLDVEVLAKEQGVTVTRMAREAARVVRKAKNRIPRSLSRRA